MGCSANVYGIDIEIAVDPAHQVIDPAVAPIRRVALSGRDFDELFQGPEAELLVDLDHRLAELPPGVLATWNGSIFDLPFIAERARLIGVDMRLALCLDTRLTLRRRPLPGHAGAYRAAWGHHRHLDTFRLFGPASTDVPQGPMARLARRFGLGGIPSRPANDLTAEAVHAHAASDARLARVLTERRWPAALALVDELGSSEPQFVPVAQERLARRARADAALTPSVAAI